MASCILTIDAVTDPARRPSRGAIPKRGDCRRRFCLVGADGIHSTVRELSWGRKSPRFLDTSLIADWFRRSAWRISGSRSWASYGGAGPSLVNYFVGAGARYLNWVAITPGEWRTESWTAKGEVADALKEFGGWHPELHAIISSADATIVGALRSRPAPQWTSDA